MKSVTTLITLTCGSTIHTTRAGSSSANRRWCARCSILEPPLTAAPSMPIAIVAMRLASAYNSARRVGDGYKHGIFSEIVFTRFAARGIARGTERARRAQSGSGRAFEAARYAQRFEYKGGGRGDGRKGSRARQGDQLDSRRSQRLGETAGSRAT